MHHYENLQKGDGKNSEEQIASVLSQGEEEELWSYVRYGQERRSADETRSCGSGRKKQWRREQEMVQNSMWEGRRNMKSPYVR